jgi:hypothetical protein
MNEGCFGIGVCETEVLESREREREREREDICD